MTNKRPSSALFQRPHITLKNANQLTPIATFPIGWITDLDWSPDGTILAVSNVEDLSLFKFQGNQVTRQRLTGYNEPLRACQFSPDGNWIAGGGDDRTVLVWNIAPDQPNQCFVIKASSEVQQIRYSPDGRWIVAAVNDGIQIWDTTQDFALIRTLRGHEKDITTIAISPDGQYIASAGWDQTVRLWNAQNGALETILTGHTDRVNRLEFFPQSNRLASAARDGTIRIWNMSTYTEEIVLTAHDMKPIDGLAFSRDGALLVTSGRDLQLSLWDTDGWRRVAAFERHKKPVVSLAFNPDNSLLATGGGDHKVMVWAITPET